MWECVSTREGNFSVGFFLCTYWGSYVVSKLIRMFFWPSSGDVFCFHFFHLVQLSQCNDLLFSIINLLSDHVRVIHFITQLSWAVENCVLHLLPCCTVQPGKAKIESYITCFFQFFKCLKMSHHFSGWYLNLVNNWKGLVILKKKL